MNILEICVVLAVMAAGCAQPGRAFVVLIAVLIVLLVATQPNDTMTRFDCTWRHTANAVVILMLAGTLFGGVFGGAAAGILGKDKKPPWFFWIPTAVGGVGGALLGLLLSPIGCPSLKRAASHAEHVKTYVVPAPSG